jgi:hypothetical protein
MKNKNNYFRHAHMDELHFSLWAEKKYALEAGADLCGLGQGSVTGCCRCGEIHPNATKMERFSARWASVRISGRALLHLVDRR